MRFLLLIGLLFLQLPVCADEPQAIAALRTSGVSIKDKNGGKYAYIVLDQHDLSLDRLKRIDEVSGITGIVLIDHRHRKDIYLPYLKTIPGIKHLELGGVQQHFTDQDMKHVADMSSLETAYISSDSITDRGVLELAKITGLKKVTFTSKRVTRAGRERLNDSLPNCVVR